MQQSDWLNIDQKEYLKDSLWKITNSKKEYCFFYAKKSGAEMDISPWFSTEETLEGYSEIMILSGRCGSFLYNMQSGEYSAFFENIKKGTRLVSP